MERPTGVTAIAILFLLAAVYLLLVGSIIPFKVDSGSFLSGLPLLAGLALAGPHMFLLVGAIEALISFGLLKLNNWARWAAIAAALLSVVELIPAVSIAATALRFDRLAWSGLGMIVRVVILRYLFQSPVVEAFATRALE